jgi:hypothetical protein
MLPYGDLTVPQPNDFPIGRVSSGLFDPRDFNGQRWIDRISLPICHASRNRSCPRCTDSFDLHGSQLNSVYSIVNKLVLFQASTRMSFSVVDFLIYFSFL